MGKPPPAFGVAWSACLLLAWGLYAPAPAAAAGPEEPPLLATALRCEYLVNPLGLDEKRPRLSWVVESLRRGQRQTAYRVLVASDEALLKRDRGDLWDSGKVAGGETTAVAYSGKPLASHQRCHWKVRAWDKDGKPSPWSAPALWSMGLLAPGDWAAEWVGHDKPRQAELPEAPFGGARWIWHAADRGPNKPKGHRLLLTTLVLPKGAKVGQAELLVTAADGYKFTLGGTLVASAQASAEGWKSPKMTDVTAHLRPGPNAVRVEVEKAAAGPAGLLARLTVKLAGGKALTLVTDGSWKSLGNPGANWHNRAIDLAELPAAEAVAAYGDKPWGKLRFARLPLPPPALLRTAFRVAKPVTRATLYATALGVFDLYVNGKRVTEDRFNPGWTDYAKRVYYRTYDVTGLLRPGANALGAVLADGWYSGYIGWGQVRDHYGKAPRFRGQLHLTHADGSTAVVATGPGWRASTGPTREADFLMGESYDARLEQPGWAEPGFDDGKWDRVVTGAGLKPLVQAHPGPPVRACGEFKPKKITEPKKGVYVLDLGQNFAGVARLSVSGAPGQAIRLRFAERLNPDGTVYTTNLRGARAADTYVCRGGGAEVWEPRFTFHGFQYVEVTGLKARPADDTVTGVALSSDTPVAGKFECSEAMLNRLHRNIYWTQRANFIDIPTDCPQRDERLGWTGDAQVYARTATLNADVQAFFAKWLIDLEDGQRPDGQFPMVAPVKVAGDGGGPAWADAGVICPWTVYEVYGDRRVLGRHYPAMKRFLTFCEKRSTPELLPPAKFHCFGDWLSIKADTPKDVIYAAYFAHSARLTGQAAAVLGHKEDAARYSALFEKVKAAFNKAYVGRDGRIKGNTQACYVLALAFDLVDGEKRKLAARYLVEDIEARGGHLSTGFIGTKDLMLVLSKVGRADVAYRLLENETFPSWGFSIKHGATSIWERWDGWTPDKGFQDPGMNSFAHYSFGAVYQWVAENVGGIRTDGPAYRKLVLAPQPGGRLRWARTTYRSVHGTIKTDWKKGDGEFALAVTVPANTTATVLVPAARAADVTEGGKPLGAAEGVKFLRMEGGRAVLAVGSGTYQFVAKGE
jgi:alpha-L-rhamnosidase